jgi:DNA-binding transcriptional ArsR family regulator
MNRPAEPDVDQRILEALGDPIRQRIVTVICGSPAGASTLAERLDVPIEVIREHIDTLLRCDAVEAVDDDDVPADRRRYRAMLRPLLDDAHWRALPPERRQELFDLTLTDIATRIDAARAAGGFGHEQTHVSLSPLMLDEEGWQAITDLLAGVVEEAMEVAAECADRQARGATEPLFATTLVMLHFGRAEQPAAGRER